MSRKQRPALADDLRPRIGVENRLPEFIEEALRLPQVPPRSGSGAAAHFARPALNIWQIGSSAACGGKSATAWSRSLRNSDPPVWNNCARNVADGPARQASAVIGLLSRLDVPTLLELLPIRLQEWNRFYHDIVVRQIAYGAAAGPRAHLAGIPGAFWMRWFCLKRLMRLA